AGTAAAGNASYGVIINTGAANNTVGGLTAADRNVIAANQFGVGIFNASTGNVVEGNYIGTDKTGLFALGNGRGVTISLSAFGNTIGGTTAAARNVISGNTSSGV